MPFMYLHLHTDDDGINAEVKNSGELSFSSLGGASSQRSDRPFAVFRIASFSGLSAVDEVQLLDELMRRMTTKELMRHFSLSFTTDELLEMLRTRIKDNA